MLSQTGMPIRKGQWYRISFRARAEGIRPTRVNLTVTNTEVWASLFEYTRFSPGEQWEEFSFDLQARDSKEGKTRFQMWWKGTGQLWVSDLKLQPIADPTIGRWLDGLYLDVPEEWDDPYRFFRW